MAVEGGVHSRGWVVIINVAAEIAFDKLADFSPCFGGDFVKSVDADIYRATVNEVFQKASILGLAV